jgi:hypothetical protein
MGLKIRHLIQNQGDLGIGRFLIAVSVILLRGIVKIVCRLKRHLTSAASPKRQAYSTQA